MTQPSTNSEEKDRAAFVQKRKIQMGLIALIMVVSTCLTTSLLLLFFWLAYNYLMR